MALYNYCSKAVGGVL